MTNTHRARIVQHLLENDRARRRQDYDDAHSTKISLAPPNQYDDSARKAMLEAKRKHLQEMRH
jgi:hypothetical protein